MMLSSGPGAFYPVLPGGLFIGRRCLFASSLAPLGSTRESAPLPSHPSRSGSAVSAVIFRTVTG